MTQNDAKLEELIVLSGRAMPGEWDACGSERGGCKCGQVWSKGADAPVAIMVSGKWGDDYPALRFTEDSCSLNMKVEAYMEQITYGEVPEESAKANMLFIAALVNWFRKSQAPMRLGRKRLRKAACTSHKGVKRKGRGRG